MEDDIVGILFGVGLLVATIFMVVAAGTVVFFAAIPAGIGYSIYWFQVLSPDAKERRARTRTHELYNEVRRRFTAFDVPEHFRRNLRDDDPEVYDVLFTIASRLVGVEGLDEYPPAPPIKCDTIEGGRYCDFLNAVSPDEYHARIEHIVHVSNLCALPPTPQNMTTILLQAVSQGAPVEQLPKTAEKINENFAALKSVYPEDYKGDNLIRDYCKGTPLALMAEIYHDNSVQILDHLRNQHHMIIGGTGHGKTQCLQEMIVKDLKDENACVVVIDSQEGMLERLLHVVSWDRIMYLDAGNIESPLSLSAFSIGSTTRPEDEPRVRMATALYEHMFASRETKFTTKQQTLYRFLSRFLFVIPDANFDTALDILENGYEPYDVYVATLAENEQSFIRGNLDNPKARGASQGYKQTRQEVAQRLYTLLESSTIKRMFSAPQNKVNIPQAIRDDRIILINTAQQTLGLEGATMFGRYCIAQIAMEVLARAETNKRVYFYIDEAQEYLSGDPIIHRLFEQGRKRGLCMICAFHRLGQIGEDLTDMMRSLTSIKFAGGISNSDAGKLAKEMKTDAETIDEQPELSFWAWFKGEEPGVYRVTPLVLEDQAIYPDEVVALKEMMVKQYHYSPEKSADDDTGGAGETVKEESFDDYYMDDWEEPKSIDEDTPNKKPPDDDDSSDVDPDAPQDLD